MTQNKVFCFHSLRTAASIPASASWQDYEIYTMYRDHLCVAPSWFFGFVDKAIDYFGDGIEITFDDAYEDIWYAAMYAVGKGLKTTIFVPTAHIGGHLPGIPIRVMTFQELSFLAKCGINLGSHGHSHIRWPQYSKEEVFRDMACSVEILQSIRSCLFGASISNMDIAPPHGDFEKVHYDLAKSLQLNNFYGTINSYRVPGVTTRCLADMTGYIEKEEDGLQTWPWQ